MGSVLRLFQDCSVCKVVVAGQTLQAPDSRLTNGEEICIWTAGTADHEG